MANRVLLHQGCGGVLSEQTLTCGRCHEQATRGYEMVEAKVIPCDPFCACYRYGPYRNGRPCTLDEFMAVMHRHVGAQM